MLAQQRKRRVFTPAEDARLLQLISTHGTSNWSTIALEMDSRSSRQCRERWNSFLSPGHINPAWTESEDLRLRALYALHGPKWALLTQFFAGRSDYNLKNRWTRLARLAGAHSYPTPEPAHEDNLHDGSLWSDDVFECTIKPMD
jgi:hypothetical protein